MCNSYSTYGIVITTAITSIPSNHFRPFAIQSYRPGWITGIRGLMTGMANLPQGNQELLVVRDKVGRPPVSLEYDIVP